MTSCVVFVSCKDFVLVFLVHTRVSLEKSDILMFNILQLKFTASSTYMFLTGHVLQQSYRVKYSRYVFSVMNIYSTCGMIVVAMLTFTKQSQAVTVGMLLVY